MRKGQDTSPEAVAYQPPTAQTRVDRAAQYVIEKTPLVLACIALASLVILYALAPGPHQPLNLPSLISSS